LPTPPQRLGARAGYEQQPQPEHDWEEDCHQPQVAIVCRRGGWIQGACRLERGRR